MIERHLTQKIILGNVSIGGNSSISIQSMTTTSTSDTQKTLAQIEKLQQNGAEIVRVAVLNWQDSVALNLLVQESPVPIVADIHYNADFAINALKAKVPGLRLNPGNIEDPFKIQKIIQMAKEYNPVIRIGVNGGSLNKELYPEATPENIVNSAMQHIEILEEYNYTNIKVSLKATDVLTTIESYKIFAKKRKYPLHLGITEAGDAFTSSIRSSMGIGSLLMQGIGDTLRVSVAGDPLIEPLIAKEILLSLHLTKGVHLIGCPTCGRKNLEVDIILSLLRDQLKKLPPIQQNISIAIMGCVVNGFGEADHADIGVVGLNGCCEFYIRGKKVKSIQQPFTEQEIISNIVYLLEKLIE